MILLPATLTLRDFISLWRWTSIRRNQPCMKKLSQLHLLLDRSRNEPKQPGKTDRVKSNLEIVNISSRQLVSITSQPFPKAQPIGCLRIWPVSQGWGKQWAQSNHTSVWPIPGMSRDIDNGYLVSVWFYNIIGNGKKSREGCVSVWGISWISVSYRWNELILQLNICKESVTYQKLDIGIVTISSTTL